MSSMSAYVDWERSLQYPVSKGAVRNLMKCLNGMTWKDGIRVNSVAPGEDCTSHSGPLFK